MKIKEKIIHLLGGYTNKEYTRIERRYQGLLDSKTDINVVKVCNEYIWRILNDFEKYTRQIYGVLPDEWANKLYNVIHNNLLRITARYLYSESASIYKLDTTLDKKDQFKNILKEDHDKWTEDDLEKILYKKEKEEE